MRKCMLLFIWFLAYIPCMAQVPDSKVLDKAKQGDAIAQNDLGVFYISNGEEAQALYWWEQAANQNYAKAQANLGEFYCIKKDYATGLKWIVPAANRGSKNAMHRLALCYLNGTGIDKSIQKALKWSRKSAEAGMKEAYILTSVIYEKHYNDKENAKIWYKRAADNGDVQALNWLGTEEMKVGNTDVGLQYFMKAANKGFAQSQYNVGIYYFNTHEYEAAKIWLEKAAKQGYTSAIEFLKRREFQ